MANLEQCPRCESRKIIPSVRIIDRGDHNMHTNLTVQVDENPDAIFFKYSLHGVLKAWICGGCGYVETYVDNPAELYATYQQSIAKDR